MVLNLVVQLDAIIPAHKPQSLPRLVREGDNFAKKLGAENEDSER
jgi:hypothetical protein